MSACRPRPPGSPSKSASAETVITSSYAAGWRVVVLTDWLPAAATTVVPSATSAQMAPWMRSFEARPQSRSS